MSRRVALLGMPNTGKSTFFNRLTGASARTGNWPGVTVDLLSARVLLDDALVEVIDLPGIYDLRGFSDDESVVRHFLEYNPVDRVVLVLNAAQVERQLSLAVQLQHLGVPALLLLNMADEAQRLGIKVDAERLAEGLGMPVALMSARFGQGVPAARHLIAATLKDADPVPPGRVQQRFEAEDRVEMKMERLLRASVELPVRLPDRLSDRIDRVALHPWLGIPLFLLAMFAMFQAVFTLGAPLQDAVAWLLGGLRGAVLEPALGGLPAPLAGLLLDGVYDGVGTVASFVPIIVLFFLLMAVVEDSGYLSRAAYLTDALMARVGLDGRGFVMLLMGFGCNVPALMGTRVMRARGLRLLSMLIIPFSLCSARLQVFLFLTAALFAPGQAALVLFSLYLVSLIAAFMTAWLYRGRFPAQEPFALELPPYRLPTLRQMWLRGWHEIRHFLRRASTFIVLGVVLVWLLTHFPADVPPASAATWAGSLGGLLQPIFAPLGIDVQLTIALVFGFVAKEVVIGALAVIYGAEGTQLMGVMGSQIDPVQGMSFMLFTLLYTPCLSTLATMRSESSSLGYTVAGLGWSLGLAWVVSFAFYQGARLLGY